MEIIPAVDIRGGKCVRLYQGSYEQETVYSEDPVDTALRWQSAGALRLHIVDLDGASQGGLINFEIIKTIVHLSLIPVQVGGGIRTLEAIGELLKAGVDRVVLGTAAVEDPQLVEEACRRYDKSIAVSLDAREGFIATHGWRKQTERGAIELAKYMAGLGVKRFIYTDIIRDGTLTEPNFTAIAELVDALRLPVIASGG
ncbi:MAG: 1-(5-phosphoribosyl)-5-[(5-phosphoribosylamino)methylideneamino]imidazole-4-carboxamide isomerase, partial [Chloroflexi bacterium]|nr:1-(5-phosphoribosyl)-5-[(5-phosphoribosylamino)methylideneamino]imidazole-4-carboxamide isomerase [Chloroflexota bacterium]